MQAMISARRGITAVALACAMVAGACGGSDAPTAPDTSTLDWSDCGSGECATLVVPLDHDDPDGPTIDIAVKRDRASGDPLGVLVVNPGGPGGSGVAYVERFAASSPAIAERFDIVGFDPRGVGGTAPLTCDAPLQELYTLDATPDDPGEQAALADAATAATAACEAAASDLLPHLGTAVVADDLEALRVALGVDTISWFGASYGSSIGLVYAATHGDHLGPMVLDGLVDPTLTLDAWLTSQALALEDALDDILGERARAFAEIESMAEAGEIALTPQQVAQAAIATSYSPSRQATLLDGVDQALRGNPDVLAGLASTYLTSSAFDAYTGVVCADHVSPASLDDYAAFAQQLSAAAPRVGATVANELLACAVWPVDGEAPIDELDATGTAPILILGNIGDAATPYSAATAASEALPSSRLLTFDGDGHLSFNKGSGCVDDAVVAFLTEGVLPPEGTICTR